MQKTDNDDFKITTFMCYTAIFWFNFVGQ